MSSRLGFRATLNCSYAAYIVQASVNNIAPILYIIMMREFDLSLGQIAFLMSFNFVVQICKQNKRKTFSGQFFRI